jgi:hypothetical protein
MTDEAERKLSEADAVRQQAECELARVEAALARIEGDYIGGKISAEKWDRLEERLRGGMDAARAQAEQQDRQRKAVAARIAAFDAEAATAEELVAPSQLVRGQVQEGSQEDVESFRATLKRLFVGFELCSPSVRFGRGVLLGKGEYWTETTIDYDSPADPLLKVEGGYRLLAAIRPQAIDRLADPVDGYPAIHRAALLLHDNLCSRLAAW